MRSLLASHGITGRNGELAQRRLVEALAPHGGQAQEPCSVAAWSVQEKPAQVLAAWHGKPGLGGAAVDPDLQTEVLDPLEAWAVATFGGLTTPHPARRAYRGGRKS